MSSDRNLSRWGDIMLDIEEASKKAIDRKNKRMSSKKLICMPNIPEKQSKTRSKSSVREFPNSRDYDNL